MGGSQPAPAQPKGEPAARGAETKAAKLGVLASKFTASAAGAGASVAGPGGGTAGGGWKGQVTAPKAEAAPEAPNDADPAAKKVRFASAISENMGILASTTWGSKARAAVLTQ